MLFYFFPLLFFPKVAADAVCAAELVVPTAAAAAAAVAVSISANRLIRLLSLGISAPIFFRRTISVLWNEAREGERRDKGERREDV